MQVNLFHLCDWPLLGLNLQKSTAIVCTRPLVIERKAAVMAVEPGMSCDSELRTIRM